MHLANITTTSLWMATSRVTNPNITDAQFNDWYNTALLPLFMGNHNASLGVRYKIIPSANASKTHAWDYVALYKTHEANTSHAKLAFPNGGLDMAFNSALQKGKGKAKRDVGPDDVKIELSTWTPIQTFESLREKKDEVPAGRPKVACIHLDMLSMLPNYRRSTRYRSIDESKPRWLAVHELDSPNVDPYAREVLMGTELAHKVMDTAQTFDAANWGLVFEKGSENF